MALCGILNVGSCSKSKLKLDNYIDNNISQSQLNSITNSCGINQSGSNIISIDTIGAGCILDITQQNKTNNICILTSLLKNAEQSNSPIDIKNDIVDKLKAQGLFTTTSSNTEITTKLHNYLTQTQIDNITIQCIINQISDNNLNIKNCIGGANISQINENYNKCLTNALLTNASQHGAGINLINDVKKDIESSGVSLLGTIFGEGTSSTKIIIILVLIFVGIITIYIIYKKMIQTNDKIIIQSIPGTVNQVL